MSNEITVKINCSLQEMYDILKNKGFSIIDKFYLEDIYYIPKEIDVKKQSVREILKRYILIRSIIQFVPDNFINSYNIFNMTFKEKNIALDGSIINQDKKDCQIQNKEQGKAFIEVLGYKEIMTIKEKSIVYGKGELELAVKDVENGDNLIEIETVEGNSKLDTVDKLKVIINELQLPVDTTDYFVKKAEIELKKIV